DVLQRYEFLFVLDVNQGGVPLVEGATLAVLPAQANGSSLLQKRAESQRLRHPEIERTLASGHFEALLEKFFHLGMDVEAGGICGKSFAHGGELGGVHARVHFE